MRKLDIRIVILGHLPYSVDLHKVLKYKSSIFNIIGPIGNISIISNSDIEYWGYSDKNIQRQVPQRESEDILIAITSVPLEGNYYVRGFSNNTVCITYHEIAEILTFSNIPLHNFILRVLNSAALIYKRCGNSIPSINQLTKFTHDETRGCIFDMNGIKTDIVYSLDKPQLCPSCLFDLENNLPHRLEKNLLSSVQEDLKKISKPFYYDILDWIKCYPIAAFLASSSIAIILGIVGSLIASILY